MSRILKNLKENKNQRGMSLLEVLIYTALTAVILVIVSGSITSILLARQKIEAKTMVDQNIRFAMQKISQSIKESSEITEPTTGVPSDRLILVIDGSSVVYSISSGILEKKVGASATSSITTDKVITAPISAGNLFTKIENPPSASGFPTSTSIQIKMKINYNSENASLTNVKSEIQTAVSLRK